MDNVLNILNGNVQNQRLSDHVLSILSVEYPLTAKELHHKIKKQGVNSTYQAVHKSIKFLQAEKIIVEESKKYKISSEWIEKIRSYLKLIEHTYERKPSAKTVLSNLGKDPKTIHFSNFTTMCVFAAELLIEYRKNYGSKIEHYTILRHGWFPLTFNFSDFYLFIEVDDKNEKNRFIIREKTPFDRWIFKAYKIPGTNDKGINGVSSDIEEDLIARGDLVIETVFSKETSEKLDEIYNRIHGLPDLFKYCIIGSEKNNLSITMKISRDSTKAKLIRDKVKSYFGE